MRALVLFVALAVAGFLALHSWELVSCTPAAAHEEELWGEEEDEDDEYVEEQQEGEEQDEEWSFEWLDELFLSSEEEESERGLDENEHVDEDVGEKEEEEEEWEGKGTSGILYRHKTSSASLKKAKPAPDAAPESKMLHDAKKYQLRKDTNHKLKEKLGVQPGDATPKGVAARKKYEEKKVPKSTDMHTGVNPNRQKVREAYAKKAGKGDRDAAGLENRAAQQSAIRQEHKVQAKQHLDRMNNVRRPTAWEVHDDSFMGPKAEFSAQKNRAHYDLKNGKAKAEAELRQAGERTPDLPKYRITTSGQMYRKNDKKLKRIEGGGAYDKPALD